MQRKRVILSAGGTGGHLFPAQALAQALSETCDILFVAGGLSTSPYFDPSLYPFEEIACATFSFSNPLQLIPKGISIIKGVRQSLSILHRFTPDVVVGFGSFFTLPILIAALCKHIPIVLHEQNAIPGKVNRLFSRFAHTTAFTFPESAKHLKGNRVEVTFPIQKREQLSPWDYFTLTPISHQHSSRFGQTVFPDVEETEEGRVKLTLPRMALKADGNTDGQSGRMAGEKWGLIPNRTTLLVFGGSQGALRLNALFLAAVDKLIHPVQVLHFTGKQDSVNETKARYQALGIAHVVKAFEPCMEAAMQIADMAVTRAGAATISELIESETPALLIPFPYATENHQVKNGEHFVQKVGGGWMHLENSLNAEKLALFINKYLEKELLFKKKNIQVFRKNRTASELSDIILNI